MHTHNSITLTRYGRYLDVDTLTGHKGTIQQTRDAFLAYANTETKGTWLLADFDRLRPAVEFIEEHGVAA